MMNKRRNVYEVTLCAEDITRLRIEMARDLCAMDLDKKTAEALIGYVDRFLQYLLDEPADTQRVRARLGRRFGVPVVRLEYDGVRRDPTEWEEDADLHGEDADDVGERLLARMGLRPVFSYARGFHVLTLTPPRRKLNPMLRVLGAVVAALMFGLAGMWLPQTIRTGIHTMVLTPLSDVFFGLIAMLAGPMVFLSVFLAVCSMGDATTFGRFGGKILTRMVFTTVLCILCATPLLLLVTGVRVDFGAEGGTGIAAVLGMLFGIFPDNLVRPFLDGNSLQIILLALGTGLAVLIVGERAGGLIHLAEGLQSVSGTLMGWLTSAMPLLIFTVVLSNIWSGSVGSILGAWIPFLLPLGLSVLFFGIALCIGAWRMHVPVRVLLGKFLPACLIGLSTASSAAAFLKMEDTCCNRCGVQSAPAGLSIPLGMVLEAPAMGIMFVTCALWGASHHQMTVGIPFLVTALLTSYFLAVATPPAAGGGVSCLSILFVQLGIPADVLAVCAAVYVVADFYMTAVQIGFMQLDTVSVAYRNHWLDPRVLVAPIPRGGEGETTV